LCNNQEEGTASLKVRLYHLLLFDVESNRGIYVYPAEINLSLLILSTDFAFSVIQYYKNATCNRQYRRAMSPKNEMSEEVSVERVTRELAGVSCSNHAQQTKRYKISK